MKVLSLAIVGHLAAASLLAATAARADILIDSLQFTNATPTGGGVYTWTESGFPDGGVVSGTFTASDLNTDGQISKADGEVTAFSMSFSGGGGIAPFTLGLADLALLDSPAAGGVMDIVASNAVVQVYVTGPGVGAPCNGVATCGQILYAPAPPVPEPGAWGLMLIGVGAVGGMLRRRTALA